MGPFQSQDTFHYRGFPVFYSACGGSYFRKTLGGGSYAHMWSGDTTL